MRRTIAQSLKRFIRFSDIIDAPDFDPIIIDPPANPDIPYEGHEGELVVIADDGTSITFDQPRYDIICFFEGTIPNSQLVLRFPFSRRVYFPAGMTGSVASIGVAATAETVLSLQKNLVEFATITFAAAGTIGTVTSPADIRFEIGDVLTVHGPSPVDSTAADLGFTLNGERRLTG